MRAEEAARPGARDKPASPFDALLAASGEAGVAARVAPAQQLGARCRPAEGVGTSDQGDKSGDTATSSGVSENIRGDGYVREECSEVHNDTPGAGSGAGEAGSQPRRGTKRARMVWTGELHERFLNAVNHLGMNNAVPKTILRMMNVDGMTRENVASHLQKYRLHLKRQATGQGDAPAPVAVAPPAPAAPPAVADAQPAAAAPAAQVAGVPLQLLPAPAQAGTALGVPVCAGVAGIPASMAHIPHQAWSAGVPGYDALRVLQSLSAAAAAGGGGPAAPAAALAASLAFPSSQPPAQLQQPALDIAPLSTAPPASPAATR